MSVAIPPEDHGVGDPLAFDASFPRWRVVHRAASFGLCLLALLHVAVSFTIFDAWTPDAVWFVGTGLGLLLLGGMNLAHVGLEPCRMPTVPAVRTANWAFVVFGVGAVVAVPEPQAVLIVVLLVFQAVASHRTLLGSA